MLRNDLIGLGLFLGYFVAAGLPLILCNVYFKAPFEVARKMLHFLVVLSIFPLVMFFQHWYMAVLAAFLLVLLAYPLLRLVENSAIYRRIAVERKGGEFKRSLVIVQISMAIVISIFWGILGAEWRYVAVVAVLAWGFGDAAAALIGKTFGRRRIIHPRIEGAKTVEGTQAMYVTAALAVFGTLVFYAGQPWLLSLAVALLVAPVCAVVELFSNGGMDTLTVPISTGLAVLSVMTVLTHLGI